MQSHMPSSDTNLHHLTTKGPLLISKAHSPWLTAWHAEGIREKECGGEGRPARITHTPAQTSLHILTSTQIYFCPWQAEPSCPHILPLSCWKGIRAHWVASSLLKEKKKVIPVSVGVGLADHEILPAEEAERDKQDQGRAHYSSEDRRWRLLLMLGTTHESPTHAESQTTFCERCYC